MRYEEWWLPVAGKGPFYGSCFYGVSIFQVFKSPVSCVIGFAYLAVRSPEGIHASASCTFSSTLNLCDSQSQVGPLFSVSHPPKEEGEDCGW